MRFLLESRFRVAHPASPDEAHQGLATSTAKRSPQMADVPTFEESGVPDFVLAWYGVLAPAGTPRHIVEVLRSEIRRAMGERDVQARFAALRARCRWLRAEEFRQLIAKDVKRWKETAAKANIRFDLE